MMSVNAAQKTSAQPRSWGLAQQAIFAADVQRALGLTPTVQGTALLVGWGRREGTGSALASDWNPLATTASAPGARDLPGNSAGVKVYPSRQVGVTATAETLKNYPGIVSYLRGTNTDLSSANSEFLKWSGGGYDASGVAPYAQAANREIISSPAAFKIAQGGGGGNALGSAAESVGGAVKDIVEAPGKAAKATVSAAEAMIGFFGKVGTVFGFVFSMRGVFFLFGLIAIALGIVVLIKTTTGITPGPPQAMAKQAAMEAAA